MRFPSDFIDKVSEANNLVDVIGSYTQLKVAGGGLMGRCPFPDHPEKTASFSVSETKQVYHCFGCGKSGNIFTFLRDYQGLSFPDAVEYLAQKAGLPLPISTPREHKNQDEAHEKKLLHIVNRQAQGFFFENLNSLPQDHSVRAYVARRGLNKETINEFNLGYAPPEWDRLVTFLRSQNVPLGLAEKLHLIRPRSSGGHFDLFKDRLMFPIRNPLGEVVGFGGRIIDQGQPKYLNSPESPVFNKGKILYGLDLTAKHIRSQDQVIVVEGYMDLVALYQSGIKNVVAIMGTALTPEHGKLIKRLTKNVVLLLDGDDAGQAAAERSLPILLQADLHPRGLTLPDGLDPDDFLREKGVVSLRGFIDQAKDLASVCMGQWLVGFAGEASQKIQFVDRLRELLAAVPDPRLRDLYMLEGAKRIQVDYQWIKKSLGSRGAPTSEKNPGEAKALPTEVQSLESSGSPAAEKFSLRAASILEKQSLALALKTRANFDLFLKAEGMELIHDEGLRKVFLWTSEVYRQDRNHFDRLLSQLVAKVDEPESLFYKDLAQSFWNQKTFRSDHLDQTDRPDPNDPGLEHLELKVMKDLLRKLKEKSLRTQLKKLAQDLRANPSYENQQKMLDLQKEVSLLAERSP